MTDPAPTAALERGATRIDGNPPVDLDARVRLGASPDAPPDLLEKLANDPAVTVRAAVALNSATPAGADRVLARDSDERVRTLLAHRLATLLPGLQRAERDRLRHHVLDVLADLVRDEAVRVRTVIADVVKEMPEAPRDLVLRLAHDSEVPVSEPVTRLSPLLTTEDLLELLAAAPNHATAAAVAARTGLDETVADSLAANADAVAVGALLANHSAGIREATLDALVARGASRSEWHAALVSHPRLSPAAACALSEYVAAHLLSKLANRADLKPACAAEMQRRLTRRLQQDEAPCPTKEPSIDEAMGHAQALSWRDQLNEAALLGAVQRGETRMVTALLAVAAAVPASVVDRAAALRSTKGLVSLVWRAGFSMQVAGPLQSLLGRIAPEAVLRAGPAGAFPLATEEMRWQIEFLLRMGR